MLRPWRDSRRKHMWYTGWLRDTTRPVEVIPDLSMMSPLALIRQLNGFDETLKLYFTEDDICRRILNAGYEIHFVAEALLIHEEHASTSQVQRLASQVYFQDLPPIFTQILWRYLDADFTGTYLADAPSDGCRAAITGGAPISL